MMKEEADDVFADCQLEVESNAVDSPGVSIPDTVHDMTSGKAPLSVSMPSHHDSTICF